MSKTTATVVRSKGQSRSRPNIRIGDVAIIIAPISVTGFSSTVGSMRQAIEAAISDGGSSCSGVLDPGDNVTNPAPCHGPLPRDR